MRLGQTLGIPEDVFQYQQSDRLILPSCRLGFEFEFEGVGAKLPKEGWSAYWETKPDRSLHDNGMEFVFSRPWFGADAVSAVENLLAFAIKKAFKISRRTGFHIHVDVRDMTRVELSRLVVLYALFEKAVYNFAGNDRDENVFCLPWYKSDQMSIHANNVCTDYRDLRDAAKALENEKYGGLNLDCLVRFGTVEFRHALTTTDFEWCIKWANICLAFKRAAQKLDASPIDLVHNLSAIGVENFAQLVFEDMYGTLFYPNLVADVWRTGVETALLVLPKQQEVIDKASLSWNQKNAVVGNKAPEVVNTAFKAYVERNAKKEEPARTDRYALNLDAGVLQPLRYAELAIRPTQQLEFEPDDYSEDA